MGEMADYVLDGMFDTDGEYDEGEGLVGPHIMETSWPLAPRRDRVYREGDVCPRCKASMRRLTGKNGPFYGCTRFPACKGNRNA